MVVAAAWVGASWGGLSVTAASPFKSPQNPPKQVYKSKFQGSNATANFYNSTDCVYRYASVSAGESVSKGGGGKPVKGTAMSIYIENYDYCAGQYQSAYGDSALSPGAFSVQGNLTSATLNATIQLCCDQNGASFPATVNVTWTGTGSISKGKYSYSSQYAGCKYSYTSQGDSRPAVASGSITALGQEFVGGPSDSASLASSSAAEMQINCN
jgi:hypothetical protein